MNLQEQIGLLKRLLHHVESRTTCLADAPWCNDVSVYTDPKHFSREQQILFREYPILMGFASTWAVPGSYRTDDYAGVPILIVLSLVYLAGLVVFALVTLPVELGASRRALQLLHDTRLAGDEESREIRRVLSAAALTYFGGLLGNIGTFAALVFIAEAIRRGAGG